MTYKKNKNKTLKKHGSYIPKGEILIGGYISNKLLEFFF